MYESQRRFPRIASHHSVLVTKLDGKLEEFALTRTLAVGGCSFISVERVGEGSPVELLIAIDRENVIKVRGRVVYERMLDGGRSEVGVEFVQMDAGAADRIERLLDRRAPHQHSADA